MQISVRFLSDSTIKIIEAAGQIIEEGLDPVTASAAPEPALAARAFPVLTADKAKPYKRPFVKIKVEVTDTILDYIKIAQNDRKLIDISIQTLALDENKQFKPTLGFADLFKRTIKSNPTLPRKTSIQGFASFTEPLGNYILSIYDNKVKLREYELTMKSEESQYRS